MFLGTSLCFKVFWAWTLFHYQDLLWDLYNIPLCLRPWVWWDLLYLKVGRFMGTATSGEPSVVPKRWCPYVLFGKWIEASQVNVISFALEVQSDHWLAVVGSPCSVFSCTLERLSWYVPNTGSARHSGLCILVLEESESICYQHSVSCNSEVIKVFVEYIRKESENWQDPEIRWWWCTSKWKQIASSDLWLLGKKKKCQIDRCIPGTRICWFASIMRLL
jgi:hypothetical protein